MNRNLKKTSVSVQPFPGATAKQLHHYVIPTFTDETPDLILSSFNVDVMMYPAKIQIPKIFPKFLEV